MDIQFRIERLDPAKHRREDLRQSDEIGAVVVVTDPKDTKACAFYGRFGFRALAESRLFIPMRELEEREARGWTA